MLSLAKPLPLPPVVEIQDEDGIVENALQVNIASVSYKMEPVELKKSSVLRLIYPPPPHPPNCGVLIYSLENFEHTSLAYTFCCTLRVLLKMIKYLSSR